MVRVRIELVRPDGGIQLLQELVIVNNGTGDKVHGNYDAWLSHASGFRAGVSPGFEDFARPQPAETWKRTAVTGWRRNRSAAELVHAVLVRCFGRGR